MPKVNKLTTEEKQAIIDKSPLTLPNNPTQSGYSSAQIKQKMAGMVTDAEESVLAILDEKLEEIDDAFTDTDGDVAAIDGRLTTVEGKVSTLEGQNLNTRLTTAESDINQLESDVLGLVNTKTDLTYTNAQLALKANLASPALTGTPTAPTANINTDSTQIATTQFVTLKEQNMFNYVNGVAAIKANSDSPFFTGTPTAPTQPALDNSIKLATTAYADNAVSVLENYTDGQLDLKVNKTQTIIGIDLQDNILLGEFKTALGNATTSLDGLMSSADKAHLNALVALLETSDSDSVVNTIGEILAIFNQYPEGADLVTALNGKVDKIAGKGLSTNDITDTLKGNYDTAYSHSQIVTGNPHGSTPADIGAEPANANIQAHVTITNGTNPHQTTFANIATKPTTIAGYGITDAYDKTYIDGLSEYAGWQQTNIATALTNGQTVATSTLTGYDRIMFVCRNTSTGELDTDEITSASVVNGYRINFFENANINFTFGTTTSTFNTTSGFELRVTGAILTQQLAENINTNETGVSLQTALNRTNPLDAKIIALNNRSLREVFEGGQLVSNSNFDTNITGWTNIDVGTPTVTNGIASFTATNVNGRLQQTFNVLKNKYYYVSRFKSNSNQVAIQITNLIDFGPDVSHSGSGSFEIISGLFDWTNFSINANGSLRVIDKRTSGWTLTEIDYFYAFNTTTLGIAHLTKAQLDEYFALYLKYKQTDNWFADLDVRKANRFIDIPVAELGNRTLREMFEKSQLTTNADFDNGIAGWGSSGGTRTTLNGIYIHTGNGTSVIPQSGANNSPALIGHIIYNPFRMRTTSTGVLNIISDIQENDGINYLGSNQTGIFSPVQNVWYERSGLITLLRANTKNLVQVVAHFYSTAGDSNNKVLEVDYAYAYNLTTLGLTSLTKARLDYLFNLYQQYRVDNGLFAVADALNLLREDNREQDKRLADIEENLRKANSGAITATASGTDVISLGKDTNNAPAQIGVDGGLLQATQRIANSGNPFVNTNGYAGMNATLSISSGLMQATILNTATNSLQYRFQDGQSYVVGKHYFSMKIDINVVSPVNFMFRTAFGSGAFLPTQHTINAVGSGIKNLSFLSEVTTQGDTITDFGLRDHAGAFISTDNLKLYYFYTFNISTLIANKQYSPLFNTTFDLMTDANIQTQMDLWVSQGILPNNNIQAVAMNKRVRSVGKNLFNEIVVTGNRNTSNVEAADTARARTNAYTLLKPNTQYIFKAPAGFRILTIVFYDYNKTYISGTGFNTNEATFTMPSNAHYVRVTFLKNTPTDVITEFSTLQNFTQLEEGSTATTFAPYTTSDAFLQPNTSGYRLPNGVRDTIEFRNGKYYFVKRVQEYVLKANDISGLLTTTTNVDLVRFLRTILTSYYSLTSAGSTGGSTYADGWRSDINENPSFSGFDNVSKVGTFTTLLSTSNMDFVVAKGAYANLASAQTALAGTKIYYQLATPIETEILANGIPQSYQGGTIYVDDMMADADLYTTNALISNTAYPIKSLDRIVRINADGSQTELAISGATIAGNKLSFTHTGLVANDIVWFSYTYDIANTFKSLTTATYYDNPFIAVAPNGTARRLVPAVDNAGAVTWTSVAI
jgi:hypothetical protein